MKSPCVLIVMDGWGINPVREGNAVALANTPNMDWLVSEFSHTQLEAAGEAVGLPAGQIGGSEVGHLNLGAGKLVLNDLFYINSLTENGDFYQNPVLVEAIESSARSSTLHIMGLVSDGGVHSHITHLFALLDLTAKRQVDQLYVHAFLDGRDVPPQNARKYLEALEHKLAETGIGQIATVMGRYYSMDRDARWARTQKAYDALVLGKGRRAQSPIEALKTAYERGETDEFITPTVIVDQAGKPLTVVKDGDTVIFFNFRGDRARQLCHALLDNHFDKFDRAVVPQTNLIGFTKYADDLDEMGFAFEVPTPTDCLAHVLSRHGMRQLHIAESEKYVHVTFFFNGLRDQPYPGEDRIEIPSPLVATYDLKPEMSAFKLAEVATAKIQSGEYDFIILNFANCDMVGHTGKLDKAITAVEVVDQCLGKVINAVLEVNGTALVTADHGNVEQMIDYETGGPHTAHTLNPVPFILVKKGFHPKLRQDILSNVTPTILELLGIKKPPVMTSGSLIA